MQLNYKKYIYRNPPLKIKMMDFINKIHGLDLGLWDEKGLWDYDNYIPYTYFDENDKVVSGLNVFYMDFIFNGKKTLCAQFSGVGTEENHRRKGLAKQLTEKALEDIHKKDSDAFIFLFADDEAVPFYENSNFVPVKEYSAVISVDKTNPLPGLTKLSIQNDFELIKKYLDSSLPVSFKMGCCNKAIRGFHVLYTLSDKMYHIPELELIISFKIVDGMMSIYEILGEKIPLWDEILPYIYKDNLKKAEFFFTPDSLGINDFQWLEKKGNNPFIYKTNKQPLEKLIFPYTCHA